MRKSIRDFAFSHFFWMCAIIAASVCITFSLAFAAIVSGTFATNTSTNITTTYLTITKPSLAVAGELLLASIAINGGTTENISAPPGWNLILKTDHTTNTSIVSYWSIATSSETENFTWTITPQSRAIGSITRYSGVDTHNPIDASGGASGTGASATAASITTTGDNAEIVALFAFNAGLTSIGHFSTPSGMTEKYDLTYPLLGPATALDDATQAIGGVSGAKTSNLGISRNWVAQQIALRPTPPIPVPVSYWKLNEVSGNAIDSAGTNNLTNTAVVNSTGKINNAGFFNRTSSKLEILDSAQNGLDISGDMSISAWVNVETPPGPWNTAHDYPIVQKGHLVGQGSERSYDFIYQAGPGEEKELSLFLFGAADQSIGSRIRWTTNTFPTVDLGTGIWHHLVVSCITANPIASKCTLYVDGASLGYGDSNNEGGGGVTSIFNSNAPLSIGAEIINPSEVPYEVFHGLIDEVGIWSRALTSGEVTSLYNGGVGSSYPF